MKVLIADDEPISRRLLQNYLEKWGYQVVVAENGARAWQLFQDGDFHMVISDWLMPEVDGLELVRRIRAHANSGFVYAILVTVRAQKEDLVEAMEAGADDFISKPFDRDELRVRLREGERIIQLQQTLSDQNRRLAQVERGLAERSVTENASRLERLANQLREPLVVVQQCAHSLQTALPDLIRVDHELKIAQAKFRNTDPELAETLNHLASEYSSNHQAMKQRLDECHRQLGRIEEILRELGESGVGDR
jgi:two-component system NtrC family sensor kinase